MDPDATWKDVLTWRSEAIKKDELLSKRKPLRDQPVPPIRQRSEIILGGQAPVGLQQPANAQAEKEKGNACFQKRDYIKAIDHYSKAIKLDPSVAVYFINRAMALLKLERFAEAEQDCALGIKLEPTNVKALWRRGLALQGLGKTEESREVLNQALKIDPSNKAVLDELAKLPKLPQPSSRRLSIKVLDQSYPDAASAGILPVQSNTNASSPPASAPSPTEVPASAMASSTKVPAKYQTSTHASRPTPGPERPSMQVETAPAVGQEPLRPFKPTCPGTNIEFERDWKACYQRGNDTLYQYLKCIPPSSYSVLFRASLESSQFEKIIEILSTHYTRNDTKEEVVNVLEGLSKVRRVDMLVMFLNSHHSKVLNDLLDTVKGSVDDARLVSISKAFGI